MSPMPFSQVMHTCTCVPLMVWVTDSLSSLLVRITSTPGMAVASARMSGIRRFGASRTTRVTPRPRSSPTVRASEATMSETVMAPRLVCVALFGSNTEVMPKEIPPLLITL